MFRFLRSFVPIVMLVAFSSDLAFAQPGGDSRSRGFMGFLDRNRNGVIEASEFEQMPGRFRETLEEAGVDTSRSMTQQEFERVMPQIMERMRSRRGSFGGGDRGDSDSGRRRFSFSRSPGSGGPGFGGPPGPFSRPDGDRDDDRRSDYDRDSMRSRYGSFQSDRGGDSDSTRSRSSSSQSGSSSKSKASKPVRTTVDLNQEFVPLDTDQDGQVGLYEWRNSNPGKLAEFFSMDLNGDGFLTPKEIQLSKAGTPQRSAASFMFALNTGQTGSVQSASPSGSQPSASTSAKPATNEKSPQAASEPKASVPSTDPMVNQANYFFKLLDRDKDSSVSPAEWEKSRSMRRMFEEANIDLTVAMSQDQFVKHYVAIKRD